MTESQFVTRVTGAEQPQSTGLVTRPEQTRFDPTQIAHQRIERYRPILEGFGGRQIVYSLPGFPDKVVKIDAWDVLFAVEAGHFTYEAAKEELSEAIQKNEAFARLASYFGEAHTLFQRSSLLKVPVNADLVSEVEQQFGSKLNLPDDLAQFSGNQVWSVVTVQEKSVELHDPQRLSFCAGYAELRPEITAVFVDTYAAVTANEVFAMDQSNPIDVKQLSLVHQHMGSILSAAAENPGLQIALADFTKRALKYVIDTGNLVDLAGRDNVIFTAGDSGAWNFKLVDAEFPAMGHAMVTEAKVILSKIAKKEALSRGEIVILKNTLNCVRILNGMAHLFGITDRIQLVPEDALTIDPRLLLKIIRDGAYT